MDSKTLKPPGKLSMQHSLVARLRKKDNPSLSGVSQEPCPFPYLGLYSPALGSTDEWVKEHGLEVRES